MSVPLAHVFTHVLQATFNQEVYVWLSRLPADISQSIIVVIQNDLSIVVNPDATVTISMNILAAAVGEYRIAD